MYALFLLLSPLFFPGDLLLDLFYHLGNRLCIHSFFRLRQHLGSKFRNREDRILPGISLLRCQRVLPDRLIAPPGILYVMDRQAEICIKSGTASLHVLRVHIDPELPVSAAHKNVSKKCLTTACP